MKELYIAPELNVICFAPVERLAANDVIYFDDLLEISGNSEAASVEDGDIDLDL